MIKNIPYLITKDIIITKPTFIMVWSRNYIKVAMKYERVSIFIEVVIEKFVPKVCIPYDFLK